MQKLSDQKVIDLNETFNADSLVSMCIKTESEKTQ